MTLILKISALTIILFQPFVSSFGQGDIKTSTSHSLTIGRINKICDSIDKNKSLSESIEEGENVKNKNWSFETYYLRDEHEGKVYRITHNISEDKYRRTLFYYNNKKVIKAILTITDKKVKYSAVYYFDNNRLIKKIGENINYSNYKDILKQALDLQDHFYKDNHT